MKEAVLTSISERHWKTALLQQEAELWIKVRHHGDQPREHLSDRATYILGNSVEWLSNLPENSLHGIVTDPPFGLVEYDSTNQKKLRTGRGGVWRSPLSLGGIKRRSVPRFTVLTADEIVELHRFLGNAANAIWWVLVPGGHVFIASNPLVSTMAFHAFQQAGFEKRGEVIRLVQTLRGGFKPKGAEHDFAEVSGMPRSCWEPWGLFRKTFTGTLAENLRIWGTGGFRRPGKPFKDVIPCFPTRGAEKHFAPHPSLKPQRFLRQIVRAALPLGIGIICDPFAGSGSTLAVAEALGLCSIGVDGDREYLRMAHAAFPHLVSLKVAPAAESKMTTGRPKSFDVDSLEPRPIIRNRLRGHGPILHSGRD